MKKIFFLSIILSLSINVYAQNSCPGLPTVIYAGKTYNTVQIGNQCWLKENLDVGTMISITKDAEDNGVIEKHCYDDKPANCTAYGGLYQWAEMVQYRNGATNIKSPNPDFTGNIQGICPNGWHIPTSTDFQTLATAVNNDGNSLKAIGQGTGAGVGTNTSGFSALLGGYRNIFSVSYFLGDYAFFWCLNDISSYGSADIYLIGNDKDIIPNYGNKPNGFSVRCLKNDEISSTKEGNNNSEIPQNYFLSQNYPNPFNPSTVINFSLPKRENIILKIYDLLGQEIATLVNGELNAGSYKYEFKGKNFSSGIYFYKLTAGSYSETKKMVLSK